MNKKGFTLIEIIGTIVILGLLSSIVIPAVMKVVREAKNNAYNEQIAFIEKAAERWSVYNVKKLSESRNYYLSTDDLLNEGYIDGDDIKDPRNDANSITGCVVISYDSTNSQYVYNYTTNACTSLGSNVVETSASCFTASGATITGFTCSDREITIPKKINGTTITAIGNNAFKTKYLNSVELQEGIVTIGANAFEDNRIKKITIPSTVRTIGNSAFNKNKLTVIDIPNTVTSVGTYAFANNKIRNITISTGLNQISEGVFNNNQIVSVKLDGNIKTVGANSFKGNNITTLTLKSGVTTINGSAFMDNSITNVNFPASTRTIGANAFANNKIASVKLNSSLQNFDCSAFINNNTSSLSFLSANTSIQNVNSCVNTNNKYKISVVNVPVGTREYYSAFDGNGSDEYLKSWRINEQ